jgi:hypothetical protein
MPTFNFVIRLTLQSLKLNFKTIILISNKTDQGKNDNPKLAQKVTKTHQNF